MNTLTATLVLCFAVAAYGFRIDGRIVGGNDAPSGMFPYQASLREDGDHICGGSIINARYILTAAHCVWSFYSLENVQIVVGTNYLNKGGVAYGVEKVIIHNDFDYYDLINDVALIRLNRDIAFDNMIKPIKLATGNTNYEGEHCLLSGWGTTKAGGNIPNNLQYVNLVVENQEKCKEENPTLQASHICTYTKVGEGACNGDSGGPLVSHDLQIGIVSSGIPCAIGYPDVYTRVSSFTSWIQAQQTYLMNGNVAKPPADAIYIV